MMIDEKVLILRRALLRVQRNLSPEQDNELCLIADALEECAAADGERRAPLRHEGLDVTRLKDWPRERAFAAAWKTENPPNIEGILERLMRNLDDDQTAQHGTNFRRTINQRDATIVATVIQWLGSMVGQQFLIATLHTCGTETMDTEVFKRVLQTREEYISEFTRKELAFQTRRSAARGAIQSGIEKTKGFFGDPEAHAALQKALAAMSDESDKEAA